MFSNLSDAQKIKILKGVILGQTIYFGVLIAAQEKALRSTEKSARELSQAFNLVKDHINWDDPEMVRKARDYVTFHEMVDPLEG